MDTLGFNFIHHFNNSMALLSLSCGMFVQKVALPYFKMDCRTLVCFDGSKIQISMETAIVVLDAPQNSVLAVGSNPS